MTSLKAIDPALLYHRCDPQELAFETTAELPELTAALGQQLKSDMQQLMEELSLAIPSAFESDEYRSRFGQIEAEFNQRQEKALGALGQEAASQNIGLLRTPGGFSFAPLKDGEVISAEDYAKLPRAEQEKLEQTMSQLQVKLEKIFLQVRQWRRDLLGFARKRLGAAVAPKEIDFIVNLPKTRSGKIMRRLLKARELGLPEGDTSTLEDAT